MSEPRRLKIDIWSDVMCPWCLVGWGNLRQALDQLEGEVTATVLWHSFELNPDMPAEGEERTAHIARKYGRTLEQSRGVQTRMQEAAEEAGVSLEYEGEDPAPPAMMWNTFLAHQLLLWARETYGSARQTDLELALFEAHFNRRMKIGERDVLLEIAETNGFNAARAAEALDGQEFAERVRAEERAAWDLNITGVPAMIVDDRYMIPGAQPPETYVSALRRVAQQGNV